MLHAFGCRKPADTLDYGRQFRSHVIGQYLDPVVSRQLAPHCCGSAEALILPGLAEHLGLNSLRRTESPQNLDQETFLIDGQEIQAGTSIDDRPDAHVAFPGAAVS